MKDPDLANTLLLRNTNLWVLLVIFQDASTPEYQYTFAQVRDNAIHFGRGLRDVLQLRKGEVVCTVDKREHHLSVSGARGIITHASILHVAIKACSRVGIPVSSILVVGNTSAPWGRCQDSLHLQEVARKSTDTTRPSIDPKNDLSYLTY